MQLNNKREFSRERLKHEIFNDHFQNYKRHALHKAQLVIADIPYNVGKNAYGSNPAWYVDGDSKNGASELAGKEFFDTDKDFRVAEFMHFCSKMLIPEPKEKNKAPCMIVFCAWEQQQMLVEKAKEYGFEHYIPLVFTKNFSAQVLKANMRVVGNCEYALILYRDKLPKFNNFGKMIFNAMEWSKDTKSRKIHPTQKPISVLSRLINIFTDEGDVVIDPVCGSGSTIIAAYNCLCTAYGFEIKKDFFAQACKWLDEEKQQGVLF